jgi:radical SAM protein with 4Fe4S-binding SPASM domain
VRGLRSAVHPVGWLRPDLFGELQIYVDRGALVAAADLGRDEFEPPPDDLDGALRTAFDRGPAFLALPRHRSLVSEWVRVPRGVRYLDLTAVIDLPGDEPRRYEHSKLFFSADGDDGFSSERVICFRVRWLRRVQTVRLLLPESIRLASRARFRLEPLPYCGGGRAAVHSLRFAREDGRREVSRIAGVYALKEQTLHAVQEAEESKLEVCEHYPSSLSVELTARCNLTCSHCSSHGEADLHHRYNRMPEMTVARLERLADETFPSLTALGIVGRGEPLAVSNRLWSALIERLRRDRVFLTAVTNGTFMARRVTPELMPLLETLTVSVDGGSQETFGSHRGGARLEDLLEQVAAYDELRRSSGLTRRPRLGFSWTLMRDNIDELPRFLERVAPLQPDLFYSRHLFVFHKATADQSIRDRPDLVNGPLAEAHALLARYDIRSDCPPLVETPTRAQNAEPADGPMPTRSRDRCMFVHKTAVIATDGEVPTCSAPFVKIAGRLDDSASFAQIWNGEVMRAVRAALDTDTEWSQCQNCWFREGRYRSQRGQADRREPRYDLSIGQRFTKQAWDYSSYTQ